MYQVANSYPKGSKDFVNVFDIAVRMYPTDAVANLNAGAVALSQKDLDAAVKFMEKADHNTAEFINNTESTISLTETLTVPWLHSSKQQS